MSNTENTRLELFNRLRFQHGVRITPRAIETIEQFFHDAVKTSIYHVGMYRAINVVFTIVGLAGWIIFRNTELIHWMVPLFMVVFMVYNIIHLLFNWFEYRTMKEPEPVDDDMIPKQNPDVTVG